MLYTRRPERAVNKVYRAFDVSLLVSVLYTQNKLSARLLGKQVRVKARPEISYMHKARRGRCESRSYSSHKYSSKIFLVFSSNNITYFAPIVYNIYTIY